MRAFTCHAHACTSRTAGEATNRCPLLPSAPVWRRGEERSANSFVQIDKDRVRISRKPEAQVCVLTAYMLHRSLSLTAGKVSFILTYVNMGTICLNHQTSGNNFQGFENRTPEFRRPPGILRHAQLGEANNALDMHAETKTVVAQLVICCEFAEIAKEAAAKATIRSQASSSMSSSDDVSSSTSARERKLKPTPVPRLGERYIHKMQCVFARYLASQEIRSLVKQIEMAMATNRRAGGIFDLHVTSWQPGSDVDVFGRFINAHTWPMTRHTAPLSQLRDLFPLEKLVMLSPDAPEPLDTIERDKVYCIGGIIDRTVCKVQEHAEALGMGQGTMRSPVLNVSDVVVALVQVARGQDWAAALSCSIPQRKKRATTPKPPRQRARKLGGQRCMAGLRCYSMRVSSADVATSNPTWQQVLVA
eukprot:250502-Chlamydomonas_euryale.AAC.16